MGQADEFEMIVFSWSRTRSASAPTGCARRLDRRRLRRLCERLDGLVRLESLDAPVGGPVAAAGLLLRHALGALLDLISQHGPSAS